jgi:hypothetical protein
MPSDSIACDPKDRLYVADRNDARVQVFSTRGKLLDGWPNRLVSWGLPRDPSAIPIALGRGEALAPPCFWVPNEVMGTPRRRFLGTVPGLTGLIERGGLEFTRERGAAKSTSKRFVEHSVHPEVVGLDRGVFNPQRLWGSMAGRRVEWL